MLGSYYIEENTKAIASGWGFLSNPGEAALTLQWIEVTTLSVEKCRQKMTKSNAAKIFDTTICTDVVGGEGGTCLGDSGGPLVCFKLDFKT